MDNEKLHLHLHANFTTASPTPFVSLQQNDNFDCRECCNNFLMSKIIECNSSTVGFDSLTVDINLRHSPSSITWGICSYKYFKSNFLNINASATTGLDRC